MRKWDRMIGYGAGKKERMRIAAIRKIKGACIIVPAAL